MSCGGMREKSTESNIRSFWLNSAKATFLLGKQIGLSAVGGEVIGLIGPLAAGKTVFVQGLAEGLGVKDCAITSPTFVIMNLYQGRLPLCHVDLYRFNDPIETIGLDEYLNWDGVTAIEWADRGSIYFSIVVAFSHVEREDRKVTLTIHPSCTHLIFEEPQK